MKGRDFIIGAAIGLWLVVAFGGQHRQASPPAAPVTPSPQPSATSSPAVSAPATSSPAVSAPATPLPQGSPTAPASQAGSRNAAASPGPAISGGPGWPILVVFGAVIVIAVSTVVVTVANGRRAT